MSAFHVINYLEQRGTILRNYYLKCLGIIHWRLREPENTAPSPRVYRLKREGRACVYLVAEPKTAAESELFDKIAAAGGLKVDQALFDEVKEANSPVLAFGSLRLTSKSLISLPALGQLLNSIELKREVWGVLKGVVAL